MTVRLSLGMSTPRIRGIRRDLRAGGEGCATRRGSALSLLVFGVAGADDVHLAPAAHDLAVLTDPPDAGSDFHRAAARFPQVVTPRRPHPSHGPGPRFRYLVRAEFGQSYRGIRLHARPDRGIRLHALHARP